MTDPKNFWDEAFEEVARENRRQSDIAENSEAAKARRAAEIKRDIERGIRDKDGAFIIPDEPEADDDDDEEEGEG